MRLYISTRTFINSQIITFPACPQGFYGPYCRDKCDCVNGAKCDARSGRCICKPGYGGEKCEKRTFHWLFN